MAELVYKTGYLHVDHEMQALAELLAAVFGIDINLLGTYGGHDPGLTPFSYFDRSGVCVANVNVFTMPMMWNGSVIKAYSRNLLLCFPTGAAKGSLKSFSAVLLMIVIKEQVHRNYSIQKLLLFIMAKPLMRDMALMVRLPQGCSLPEQVCLPDMASF